MRKFLVLIYIFLFPMMIFSQIIVSLDLKKTSFKLGEKFFVTLKTNGKFAANNIFSIQISDKYGNFSNPIEIGRIQAPSDTIVQCTIFDTLEIGKDYRIRATASNPFFISEPNPSKIILFLGRVFFVASDGNDNNPGTQNNPFKTIQKAIDITWYYDTVLVKPGTYNENLVFRGIDITLIGINGPKQTIIDGQRNGNPVVTFENGETSAMVIDGFTIQNGVNYQMDNGPGITIKYQNTSPTLRNLIIKNNEAWAFGGGIYCYNAGRVRIIDCIIENNSAKYLGGGIYTDMTNIDVEKCIIRKNNIGGIYNWRSHSNIINSLIYWNNTDEVTFFSDLGIQMKPKIINTTIISKNKFYGFFLYGRFIAEIINSIIYGTDSTIKVIGDAYDTLKMEYSIVTQFPSKFSREKATIFIGKHFFSDDPMFINIDAENFSVDSCSPALGNALKSVAPSVDVYGFSRPVDPDDEENPDIGAVESPKSQRSSLVTITKISKTKFCKGGTFTIDFSTAGCPFFAGNEFIAELSNSSGNFNTSYELGRLKSVNSGIIGCTIPSGIPSGNNYKVRIRATNLPYRSKPYSENIAIYDNPKVTIFGPKQVCSSREYEYWTDSSEFPTNKWLIKNGYSFNKLTENKIKVIWYDSSKGSIKLIQTNIAGCVDSSIINVSILPTPSKPSIQQLSDGQLLSNYPSWNQWFWNGVPIQGATGRIHKPTKSGYYSVKIIPPTGCESEMSDSIFVNITSVENGYENFITVIQKEKVLTLRLNFATNNFLYISVVDILGNEILVYQDICLLNEIDLNLNGLLKGVYFLKVRFNDKEFRHKLVFPE
ncbi:MAG: DUF1565 domain-containing protein [Ignavibacteria bacterium]|nr:DUF1565 domain-containing protein [Ignavibacteria bacterium]